MHGQFAWYELTTSDTDAAQEFYKTFTGWGSQPFDNDYTLLTLGGVPVAGVFRLTDEMRSQGIPPNWMPYVEARNVAETTKLASSLGARVLHGPVEIPDVGDIAVLQDPQGAAFGVYKSKSGAPSWDGKAVLGKFSWNELMTTDHVKAFDFYRRLFGWEKVSEMDMGGGEMYWLFGKGEVMYGGVFTRPAEMSTMPPFWLCYIHVKDVAKSLAIATKAGAAVHRPPMEIPGGMIAILGDPQGAGFALHHLSAASAAPSVSANVAKPAPGAAKKKSAAKKAKKVVKAASKKKVAKKSAAKKSGAKKSSAKKSVAKSKGGKKKKSMKRGRTKPSGGKASRKGKKKKKK